MDRCSDMQENSSMLREEFIEWTASWKCLQAKVIFQYLRSWQRQSYNVLVFTIIGRKMIPKYTRSCIISDCWLARKNRLTWREVWEMRQEKKLKDGKFDISEWLTKMPQQKNITNKQENHNFLVCEHLLFGLVCSINKPITYNYGRVYA